MLLVCAWHIAAAQNKNVRFGDDAFSDGLYKTACEYYRMAIKGGAKDISVRYKLAESARLAFYYREAANNYYLVSQSVQSYHWPDCDYHLAQMLKACGAPDSALFFFNRYLKNNIGTPRLMEIARHETEVCRWILDQDSPRPITQLAGNKQVQVSKVQSYINSRTQVAPCIVDGDKLFFSSFLEISSPNSLNPVTDNFVLQRVYTTSVKGTDDSAQNTVKSWELNSKKHHTCNTAYDPRGHNLYFNYCLADNFSDVPCEIYVSHYDSLHWQKPQRLGKEVNPSDGTSNTQPAIGYLDDGRTILFFASNREGGFGGFDIWYSIIESDGKCSPAVNLGAPVNTIGNEITPFYDRQRGRLFFSSDHHYCYGGYDIFMTYGMRDSWSQPVNVGMPLNSTFNDIFFITDDDGEQGYLASNRNHISIDTGTASSSNCCNDIYHWGLVAGKPVVDEPKPEPEKETVVVANVSPVASLLPLNLYFDNDEPDPRSTATSTAKSYYETFNYYMFRRNEYKQHHNADSLVDEFFYHEVAEGRSGLDKLMRQMESDLQRGLMVSVTVEGYASQLHTQAYNFNLSKRRISSIVNQLLQYNGGALAKYLSPDSAGGSLRIIERPYGSSLAAKPTGDPIYGLDAARQRFIRIVDYRNSLSSGDSSVLEIPAGTYDAGAVKAGTTAMVEIHLAHRASSASRLQYISIGQPIGNHAAQRGTQSSQKDIATSLKTTIRSYSPLLPGEDLTVYLHVDATNSLPVSQILLPLTLQVQGEQWTHTLFLKLKIE